MHRLAVLSLVSVALVACSADDASMTLPLSPRATVAPAGAVGQVYTATNAAAGNAVLAFDRAADGSLTPAGSFNTGGTGTGAGLGNQGAVTLTRDGRFLLVVNAGSNTVSSFAVQPDGSLQLIGAAPSNGTRPVSVTESRGVAYVLNAGSGNISGFTVQQGTLAPIANSSQPLSAANAGGAQVQFDEAGRVLIVTEKATNRISTFAVDGDGVAGAPVVVSSSGTTPFGFGIAQGTLVVSEAFGGAPNGSAVSSYAIGHGAGLQLVSASVGTTETAACWVAVTGDGRFAYAANAGSASISGYALHQGQLTLLDANGVTATTDAGPTDLAVSHNSQFLYVLSNGGHSIRGYAIGGSGGLTTVAAGATGLPAGLNGLAAR